MVRGFLGAQVRAISPEIQEAFGLDSRKGAFVEGVVFDHAADKAGLRHGDTIIAIDGDAVDSTRELIDTVSARPPGSTLTLEVIRDGSPKRLKVTLEERPSSDQNGHAGPSTGDASTRAGITVHELNAQLRQGYPNVVNTALELLACCLLLIALERAARHRAGPGGSQQGASRRRSGVCSA